MNITASPDDLQQGYEALRDQAVGEIPSVTPRGLAILLRGGLPAWMLACPPTIQSAGTSSSRPGPECNLPALSQDLVRLLTEMALGSQRRYST